jgi:hypothetical protein
MDTRNYTGIGSGDKAFFPVKPANLHPFASITANFMPTSTYGVGPSYFFFYLLDADLFGYKMSLNPDFRP